MTFLFLGSNISISHNMEEFTKYISVFNSLAKRECTVLKDKYWDVKDISVVIDNIKECGEECINRAVEDFAVLLKQNTNITLEDDDSEEILCDLLIDWEDKFWETAESNDVNDLSVEYIAMFSEILNECIQSLAIEYLGIVNLPLLENMSDEISEKNKQNEKIDQIIKDIEQGYIQEKEDVRNALIQCINYNPLRKDVYLVAAKWFGDREKQLEEMADYFGLDLYDVKIEFLSHIIPKKIKEYMETNNGATNEGKLTAEIMSLLDDYGVEHEILEPAIKRYQESMSNVSKSEKLQSQFTFLGYTIEVSDKEMFYNMILQSYANMSEDKSIELRNLYFDAHSLDTVIENIEKWGNNCISDAIQKTVDFLIGINIYTIDADKIITEYGSYIDLTPWDNALEDFSEKCISCVYHEEQMKRYREQRKAGRGKFVGGGFGISGAIKGSVQAGTLNMATGITHSVVNAFGNFASDMKINAQKKALYSKKSTVELLCGGIKGTINSLVGLLVNILRIETNLYIGPTSSQGIQTANAIVHNITNGKIPREKIAGALVECIKNDHYNNDAYILALKYFGDMDEELERMASYFGFDLRIEKKQWMTGKLLKGEKLISRDRYEPVSMQEWIECQKEIEEYAAYIGYDDYKEDPIFLKIGYAIDNSTAASRIVGDKKYNSVEDAEQAQEIIQQIFHIAENKEISDDKMVEEINSLLRPELIEKINSLEMGDVIEKAKAHRNLLNGDAQMFREELHAIARRELYEKNPRDCDNGTYKGTPESKEFYYYYRDRLYSISQQENEKYRGTLPLKQSEEIVLFWASAALDNRIRHCVVFTNRNVMLVEKSTLKAIIPWENTAKITVDTDDYVVYVSDGRIIPIKMEGDRSLYSIGEMNRYFQKVVEFSHLIYAADKGCLIGLDRETYNKKMEILDELCYDFGKKVKAKDDSIIMAAQRGPKGYPGIWFLYTLKTLIRKDKCHFETYELPLVICKSEYVMDGILLTNKYLYLFGQNIKIRIKSINDMKIKGFFSNIIIFTSKEQVQHKGVPTWLIGKEQDYVAFLEKTINIAKQVDALVESDSAM